MTNDEQRGEVLSARYDSETKQCLCFPLTPSEVGNLAYVLTSRRGHTPPEITHRIVKGNEMSLRRLFFPLSAGACVAQLAG
jgi:hypothetical protein